MTTRIRPARRLAIAAALVSLPFLALPSRRDVLRADEPAPRDRSARTHVEWYTAPDCRLVFHAVLEGLYADGVPNQVVDFIIGPPNEPNVERSFVAGCYLCHATYEAFALYRNRPIFCRTEGADTFTAAPLPPAILAHLKGTADRDRYAVLEHYLRPWLTRKLHAMRLSDAELRDLMQRFGDLVAKTRRDGLVGYSRCVACEILKATSEARSDEKK